MLFAFVSEFFWGKVPVEKIRPSEHPSSVYQAILSLPDERWAALAREEFGVEPNHLDVEMVVQRVIETDACRNLDPPVEVCLSTRSGNAASEDLLLRRVGPK